MTRFQILLGSDRAGSTGTFRAAGPLHRVKAILAATGLAAIAIGVFVAAIVLGSILAAFLIILVVIVSTFAAIKVAIRRRQRRRAIQGPL